MIPIATTYVPSTQGVQVAVHDFGGDGPVLILCHATGFCGHTLGPMIEGLRARFRCVAIDIRGHGMTALPEGASLAWTAMADDFSAVARHLAPGDGGVLAFGHSMGASAIILAEAAEPGLVARAWVYEPILLRARPELRGEELPDIAKAAANRRATFASRQEAIDRYRSRPPLSLLDQRALEAYVDHGFRPLDDGSITLRCRPEHEALIFANHGSGAFERIGEVRMPLLVAAGGDGQDPVQWIQEAAAYHGTLSLVEYPDLTHFGPLQEPDRLADDVAMFMLGEVEGL